MRQTTILLLLLLFVAVLPQGSSAAPAPHGKLAYIGDGTLWVRQVPDGLPRRIWEGSISHPRWSPSGEWLMARQGDGFRFFLVDRDLSPEVLWGREAVWAPYQDLVAYLDDEGRLRVFDPSGKQGRMLVEPPAAGVIADPAWSPDGRWIAYTVTERNGPDAPSYVGIWRVNAGGGKRPVPVLEVWKEEPFCLRIAGWTPDGQSVLYQPVPLCSSSILADGTPLMAVPAKGGPPQRLTDAMLAHPDFVAGAPATGRLAIASGEGRITWTNKRIEVIDSRSGQSRIISPAKAAAISPAWSVDGKQIAFAAMPDAGPLIDGGHAARTALMARRIWVAPKGNANARPVTDDPQYRDESPRFTQTGILFARLDWHSRASLWVTGPGTSATRVTALDAPPDAWFGYYGWLDWAAVFDWHP